MKSVNSKTSYSNSQPLVLDDRQAVYYPLTVVPEEPEWLQDLPHPAEAPEHVIEEIISLLNASTYLWARRHWSMPEWEWELLGRQTEIFPQEPQWLKDVPFPSTI